MTSSSMSRTRSPVATSTPAWRAGPAPRLGRSTTTSRPSARRRCSSHSTEPSSEPSTAMTSSPSCGWARSGSTKAGSLSRRRKLAATTGTGGSSRIGRGRVAYPRLRVLFVSHTGEFSGAEASMLRLLDALPPDVERAVACPPDGRLAAAVAQRGIEHRPIRGTAVSFRLHPRWTAVGLADLGRSVTELRAHVRRWRPDVLHANSTRAGLLAAPLRRPPAVLVQVHDILPDGAVSAAVRHVLARSADAVVGVVDAASASFNVGLRAAPARTVRISIDAERLAGPRRDAREVRRSLGVPDGAPLLGEVAQITPWKGQIVAIEALAHVRAHHPDAHLVLVGDIAFTGPAPRYDNAAYLARLHERIAELGLEGAVHFAGHRDDVPDVMAALDLFLLPSWRDAFGTAAAEAMACGTVPLVSSDGGVG